jgi:hypothetical protein
MSSTTWMSSCLVILPCRSHARARRRAVGSLSTVAVRLPRVIEPIHTMATYYVRATGLCYASEVLQYACPHILLAFNAPPAACLTSA